MNANTRTIIGITLITATLLMVLITPVAAGPTMEPDGPPSGRATPTVTITHEETHIIVEVGEDGLEEIQSNGTVTAEAVGPGSSIQSIRVELWASSEMNYPITVDPASMDFPPGGGTEDFIWSMRVGAINESITDTVTFSGRAITMPGMLQYVIPDTTVTVEVLVEGEGEEATGEGGENEGDSGNSDGGGSGGLIAAAVVAVLIILTLVYVVLKKVRSSPRTKAKGQTEERKAKNKK